MRKLYDSRTFRLFGRLIKTVWDPDVQLFSNNEKKQTCWVTQGRVITATAQEMLKLFWHPNFHHENIVIAIFTRIFYTSYIQSRGSWHPLKFHGAN